MATSIPLESSTHYDSNSMLKIRKFNFQKIPHYKHKPIKTIATNNYVVVVGRSDLSILIFSNIDGNIDYIKTIESIPSKGPDDSMESLFLDVSGQHIIITTRSGDSFYINVSSSRQLRLSKIQGFVSSVSFGREVEDDSNNRSFLIGTTVGTIYELQLDQQGQERGCTLVMTLSEPLPITSLFFDYLGASNTSERVVLSSQDPRRVFVMFVTLTPTRLYHSCTLNFTNFKALFELPSLGFTELPGSVSHAQLHCYGTRSKSSNCQNFAMLIESGIYHGTMNFPSKRSEEVFIEAQLLPYPSGLSSLDELSLLPISVAPTAFHFLLLTQQKRIHVANKLNGELVYDFDSQHLLRSVAGPLTGSSGVGSGGSIVGGGRTNYGGATGGKQGVSVATETPISFAVDQFTGSIYMYTDASVNQLYLVDEDRFNWRIYLKKAMSCGQPEVFEQALSSCKVKDDRQQVLRAKAEYFFLHGDNRNAVQQLGSTGFVSFDEAVLRILGVCPMLLDTEIQSILVAQQQELIQSARRSGSNLPVNLRGVMRSILCESDINQSHLRRYLLEVLQKLPGSAKAQRTMLATWVSEIFLHELSSQTLGRQVQREDEQLRVGTQQFSTWRELLSDRVPVGGQPLETEFNQFLTAYKSVLNRSVGFAQLLGRGDSVKESGVLLYYAQTLGDFEQVLGQLVNEGKLRAAITILDDANIEKVETLIYKWSPLLIIKEPVDTVNMWLDKHALKPALLLPSLMRYCAEIDRVQDSVGSTENLHRGENVAVKYLRQYFDRMLLVAQQEPRSTANNSSDNSLTNFVVKSPADASLYQAYLWMLAKYDQPNEAQLISALKVEVDVVTAQLPLTSDLKSKFVDYDFVLRQCQKYGRKKSQVYAYIFLGLADESLQLALSLDISLAKDIAGRYIDDSIRKSQYMSIATHLLRLDKKPQRALQLLDESGGALTIQDLLPLLPEFAEIDAFRDQICTALDQASSHIDRLKIEMQELTDASIGIKKELDTMQSRGIQFTANQRCEYCESPAFARPFYLFPCAHAFHCDCVMLRVHADPTLLDAAQRATVSKVEDQIASLRSKLSQDTDKRAQIQLEYLQSELDGFVGADCPLCGFAMVRSIGQSLLSSETDEEVTSWML